MQLRPDSGARARGTRPTHTVAESEDIDPVEYPMYSFHPSESATRRWAANSKRTSAHGGWYRGLAVNHEPPDLQLYVVEGVSSTTQTHRS